MGRPRRTTCKIECCDQPPHIWPNGAPSAYCQNHLQFRKAVKRDGLDSMTGLMKAVLLKLRAAAEVDAPFVYLPIPEFDRRTITALIERDWMFASPGVDGVRYKITGRGLKALKVYEPARQHRDGLCPRCEVRPRHVRRSGTKDAYCLICQRKIGKRKRQFKLYQGDPDRLCPRCQKRRRHQYPGGTFSAYCTHCSTVVRRKNARKNRRKLFKAVQQGAPIPMCKLCKKEPRRVYPNCISEVCVACGRAGIWKHNQRKKLQQGHTTR
jgi:hypothetical protein